MTALIILAAGQSRRMGIPKQNLVFKGSTLLQHAINTAVASHCNPVTVVVGANAKNILSKTDITGTNIIVNSGWGTGMASSIATGITRLKEQANITSAVIMLCDQPFVSAGLINTLINTNTQNKKGIVACTYKETIGVPAFFDRKYFDELIALKGDEGAKKIIGLYKHDVELIPFLSGGIDIDTEEDYRNLIQG